jgi:hypothetical protein
MSDKRKKLYKKLDTNFSIITRMREDGECVLCGQPVGFKKLQAHHWIRTKGASTKYRWELKNLVGLCYACHIYKIHSTASAQYFEPLKANIFEKEMLTTEEYESILWDKQTHKFTIGELEDMVESTNDFIKKNQDKTSA